MLATLKGQKITTNKPFSRLFEITDYPDPPGVVFVVHGTHENQPRPHAGHTSVTQALTKVPESLESMEITLRCEASLSHCFHCEKWCPGAEFDALRERQFVTESIYFNSLPVLHIWSTIKTLPATLPEPRPGVRGP